ncbi:DNA-3-methyladenine glycosylase family protein [Desmospora profundinema]|uniref:DNA-3-methyladenine glycosylase II n=1 Tax=Desmospora profundinema TaxID=1571184 RepID=A0ABU1IPZ4_9BACL|nr:DNA-3-methyladenine glycosylase [Desmospora profundinema]MDR6225820.1 DNA-3-methyladenine glycosylase II [Desmospora profundinema]
MVRLRLKPKGIYSFQETSRRLIQFEKTAYRQDGEDLLRTIRLADRPLLLRLRWLGDALEVQTDSLLEDENVQELEVRIRRMFSLDVDLTPFYEVIRNADPMLHTVVEPRKGLHIVLDADPYECLMKTIISQQLNVTFAATLIGRLVETAGETIRTDRGEMTVFPSPEEVARLRYEDLQALQFSRRKAEYVIDLSRRVAEGRLDLFRLEHLSNEEVMEQLLPLRGVGRWTAECFLLFGLGRPDLLPAADIGLRNAIRQVYGHDSQPTIETVRQLGDAWAPWRSYATFYLWDRLSEG